MIRKAARLTQLITGTARVREEGLRVADSTEGEKRLDERIGCGRVGPLVCRQQMNALRAGTRVEDGATVAELRGCGAQSSKLVGEFCACDDDAVSALETCERFAQTTARQQVAAAPRRGCVERDDVKIARQPQVLKAIVKDEEIAFQFCKRPLRRRDTISISYDCRQPAQILCQQTRLIAARARIRKHTLAIGYDHTPARVRAPIAARQHADAPSLARRRTCQPLDQRRLARPARRDVANADDWRSQL